MNIYDDTMSYTGTLLTYKSHTNHNEEAGYNNEMYMVNMYIS